MQIATKSTDVDFWYCIGEYNEGNFVVKSIHNGSNTVAINDEVFGDYMQVMGCESYNYVAEEPVNVAGFI